jgi:hypothetical protein
VYFFTHDGSAIPSCSATKIPGMRGMAQSLHTSTGVRSAGSRRFSPSLTVRTRHHRAGRGSACSDKETP